MSVITVSLKHHIDSALLIDTAPKGICGNCNSPAINAFETICKDCCTELGLSSFPEYTYPNELMLANTLHHSIQRKYFFFGV